MRCEDPVHQREKVQAGQVTSKGEKLVRGRDLWERRRQRKQMQRRTSWTRTDEKFDESTEGDKKQSEESEEPECQCQDEEEEKYQTKAGDDHEEGERVQVAPNVGACGSHSQAMTDPEEKEDALRLLRGWRQSETSPIMKWADCLEEELDKQKELEQKAEDERQQRGLKNS